MSQIVNYLKLETGKRGRRTCSFALMWTCFRGWQLPHDSVLSEGGECLPGKIFVLGSPKFILSCGTWDIGHRVSLGKRCQQSSYLDLVLPAWYN